MVIIEEARRHPSWPGLICITNCQLHYATCRCTDYDALHLALLSAALLARAGSTWDNAHRRELFRVQEICLAGATIQRNSAAVIKPHASHWQRARLADVGPGPRTLARSRGQRAGHEVRAVAREDESGALATLGAPVKGQVLYGPAERIDLRARKGCSEVHKRAGVARWPHAAMRKSSAAIGTAAQGQEPCAIGVTSQTSGVMRPVLPHGHDPLTDHFGYGHHNAWSETVGGIPHRVEQQRSLTANCPRQ
mmetsp:Transcript_119288/g.332808  ORF Transcript_119288/g.332808 Transcript_119288/m.332808 type:complete len:250 (-) Transcript_119288:221-970(-)